MTTRRALLIGLSLAVALTAVFFYLGYRSGARMAKSYNEGTQLLREKRYAEAVRKYEAVIASDPTKDFAWYQLASASRQAGDCERALAAYRHYVELAPARNEPYYGMGVCQAKLGDRAGALVSLRRFVADPKKTDPAYIERARVLIAQLDRSPVDAGTAGRPDGASP